MTTGEGIQHADGDSIEALPYAQPDHETLAQRIFEGWEAMSPEEWTARFSHTVGSSSFDQYRYKNVALNLWIHRLHEIWHTPDAVNECRKKFLTSAEIKEINDYDF